ncbi:hypothetical protein BJ741DRAFT_670755 [Chytriomyces cf. hyalinus JEL632]|nr:hypothetical protein BJ741DRAFT_670755 [Chytriomyces cf. hyalinus JEL632]
MTSLSLSSTSYGAWDRERGMVGLGPKRQSPVFSMLGVGVFAARRPSPTSVSTLAPSSSSKVSSSSNVHAYAQGCGTGGMHPHLLRLRHPMYAHSATTGRLGALGALRLGATITEEPQAKAYPHPYAHPQGHSQSDSQSNALDISRNRAAVTLQRWTRNRVLKRSSKFSLASTNAAIRIQRWFRATSLRHRITRLASTMSLVRILHSMESIMTQFSTTRNEFTLQPLPLTASTLMAQATSLCTYSVLVQPSDENQPCLFPADSSSSSTEIQSHIARLTNLISMVMKIPVPITPKSHHARMTRIKLCTVELIERHIDYALEFANSGNSHHAGHLQEAVFTVGEDQQDADADVLAVEDEGCVGTGKAKEDDIPETDGNPITDAENFAVQSQGSRSSSKCESYVAAAPSSNSQLNKLTVIHRMEYELMQSVYGMAETACDGNLSMTSILEDFKNGCVDGSIRAPDDGDSRRFCARVMSPDFVLRDIMDSANGSLGVFGQQQLLRPLLQNKAFQQQQQHLQQPRLQPYGLLRQTSACPSVASMFEIPITDTESDSVSGAVEGRGGICTGGAEARGATASMVASTPDGTLLRGMDTVSRTGTSLCGYESECGGESEVWEIL